MKRKIHKPLKSLEASTGIEPVYTDLQAASLGQHIKDLG